ncbi:MAG: response regulator [Terracidiphilus sp.]|jgi:FixJ family two-component response regulator
MRSAAITAIPRETPISLAHLFGHELESQSRSYGAPIVFVVHDDISVRESLEVLIRCQGWLLENFTSAQEFLTCPRAVVPSCLVLDVSLSGLNGLDLQRLVAIERPDMPVIFITGLVDVRVAVQAMKAGALEFLTKPFDEAVMLSAIQQALERSRIALGHQAQIRALWSCYASLTRRERQVMALVVTGLLNKHVGEKLGISEITVKAHRGQVMQKMKAGSFAELVKIAARLPIESVAASQNGTFNPAFEREVAQHFHRPLEDIEFGRRDRTSIPNLSSRRRRKSAGNARDLAKPLHKPAIRVVFE